MSKISAYTAATDVEGSDLLIMVDTDDMTMAPTGTDKKLEISQLSPALAAAQTQAMSAATSQFTAAPVIHLLSVEFAGAGRLRLYSNSADRTTDSSRAEGVLPTVSGILYEYVADIAEQDTSLPIVLYPGSGATVYWQLDGGSGVTLAWMPAPGSGPGGAGGTVNPLIELIPNSEFDPSGDLSGWQLNFLGAPPIGTAWNSSTLLPANGTGGNIPFPTIHSITPAAYTAPSENAPPGNAAYVCGWSVSEFASAIFEPPAFIPGTRYTLTLSVAGNPLATNLNWFYGVFINSGEGTVGTSTVLGALTSFNPADGWQEITFSIIAESASDPVVLIYGGGTDGTLGYQTPDISGATVTAPLLIGDVSYSYQSQGGRAFPPQALPVGNTLGSVMSGGDPRIPRLDGAYHLRPREEVREFELTGSWNSESAPASIWPVKHIEVGSKGCFITTITMSAETFSSGAEAVFDFTINGASIFQINDPTDLPSMTQGGIFSLGAFVAPAFYIGPADFGNPATSSVLLGAQLLSVTGTIENMLITIWIYHP